jgi:hypothetical protein
MDGYFLKKVWVDPHLWPWPQTECINCRLALGGVGICPHHSEAPPAAQQPSGDQP